MNDVVNNMNDQFKQMMDVQTRALEPMRVFAGLTADVVEQIARKNYAVMGDVLEFSTKQVQLPLSSENLADVSSAQVAQTNAFVELMKSRVNEYAEMTQQFSGKIQDASQSVTASLSEATAATTPKAKAKAKPSKA